MDLIQILIHYLDLKNLFEFSKINKKYNLIINKLEDIIKTKKYFEIITRDPDLYSYTWKTYKNPAQKNFIKSIRFNTLPVTKYYFENFKFDIHLDHEQAFCEACAYGSLDMVKYLYNNGNNNISIHIWWELPFLAACLANGNQDIAEFLLNIDNKIDIHIHRDYIFICLCTSGRLALAKFLLNYSEKINSPIKIDNSNHRALQESKNPEIKKWLENLYIQKKIKFKLEPAKNLESETKPEIKPEINKPEIPGKPVKEKEPSTKVKLTKRKNLHGYYWLNRESKRAVNKHSQKYNWWEDQIIYPDSSPMGSEKNPPNNLPVFNNSAYKLDRPTENKPPEIYVEKSYLDLTPQNQTQRINNIPLPAKDKSVLSQFMDYIF